jgi:hypothetical protein
MVGIHDHNWIRCSSIASMDVMMDGWMDEWMDDLLGLVFFHITAFRQGAEEQG